MKHAHTHYQKDAPALSVCYEYAGCSRNTLDPLSSSPVAEKFQHILRRRADRVRKMQSIIWLPDSETEPEKMQRKEKCTQLRGSDNMVWKIDVWEGRQTRCNLSKAPEKLWQLVITIIITSNRPHGDYNHSGFFFPSLFSLQLSSSPTPSEISLAVGVSGGACCLYLPHLNITLTELSHLPKTDTSYFHRRQ